MLVDPGYHDNVGDNLVTYGEYRFLNKLGYSNRQIIECHLSSTKSHMSTRCDDTEFLAKTRESTQIAVWHAGGWGDLWAGMDHKRLPNMALLLKMGYQVISMPQSMYYKDASAMEKEAKFFIKSLVKELGENFHEVTQENLILLWRQEDSYKIAEEIYHFADNRLTPDIAFSVGPLARIESLSNINQHVDILFLLRDDQESAITKELSGIKINNFIKEKLFISGHPHITFKVVDWKDRKNYVHLNQPSIKLSPHQTQNKSNFDMQMRIFEVSSMITTGKVIVTDRLHGSIYSLLLHKPHVYIDQISKKVSLSRNVAYDVDVNCRDTDSLQYTWAENLEKGISEALKFL